MEFDSEKRDRIVAVAGQISTLLGQVHEQHWKGVINHGVSLLHEDKFQDGVQILKNIYGGMGSINDLYISPVNGHSVTQEEIPAVNQQLKISLSNLYELTHN